MPICMLREHLADHDSWRETFYAEANAAAMQSIGFTLEAEHRDADDPNVVVTVFRVENREQGEAILAAPASRLQWRRPGSTSASFASSGTRIRANCLAPRLRAGFRGLRSTAGLPPLAQHDLPS